jgi:hypothetical protein
MLAKAHDSVCPQLRLNVCKKMGVKLTRNTDMYPVTKSGKPVMNVKYMCYGIDQQELTEASLIINRTSVHTSTQAFRQHQRETCHVLLQSHAKCVLTVMFF